MITSSWHMNPDTNPARPGSGKGPTWAATLHDELKLPNGKTVGETPDAERPIQQSRRECQVNRRLCLVAPNDVSRWAKSHRQGCRTRLKIKG